MKNNQKVSSKKTTTEKPAKKRDFTPLKRAGYLILFVGSLASVLLLTVIVSNPSVAFKAVAGVNAITAMYFVYLTIK